MTPCACVHKEDEHGNGPCRCYVARGFYTPWVQAPYQTPDCNEFLGVLGRIQVSALTAAAPALTVSPQSPFPAAGSAVPATLESTRCTIGSFRCPPHPPLSASSSQGPGSTFCTAGPSLLTLPCLLSQGCTSLGDSCPVLQLGKALNRGPRGFLALTPVRSPLVLTPSSHAHIGPFGHEKLGAGFPLAVGMAAHSLRVWGPAWRRPPRGGPTHGGGQLSDHGPVAGP